MQLAVGAEVAAAVGVVDHVGHVVDAADHHHHVAGDVDQVADLQRGDRRHALVAAVAWGRSGCGCNAGLTAWSLVLRGISTPMLR